MIKGRLAEIAGLTGRSNFVGLISGGRAAPGLRNVGPYAAKPVMEGRAALYKRLAGIDAFEIEIASRKPEETMAVISALEPTFRAIIPRDIKELCSSKIAK